MRPVLVAGARKSRQVPFGSDRHPTGKLPNTTQTRQCDSKHPRCTACATAGVQCNQEDRHRKTLTPRGHVEKIERQLMQCSALLSIRIPGFSLDDLDKILAREGIEIDLPPDDGTEAFHLQAANGVHRQYHDGPPTPLSAKGYPYPPHMLHPGYPPMSMPPPGYSPVVPYPHMGIGPATMYDPRIHPAFQQHPHAPPPPPQARADMDIKGQDPQANDMSSDQVLNLIFFDNLLRCLTVRC